MKHKDLTITVLDVHSSILSQWLNREMSSYLVDVWENHRANPGLRTAIISAVPYGIADNISWLTSQGVAHDVETEQQRHRDYTRYSVRFTREGHIEQRYITFNDLVIPVSQLEQMLRIYRDGAEFRQICKEMITVRKNMIDCIPWDNQEIYGKRYQTKRLLTNGQAGTEQSPGQG